MLACASTGVVNCERVTTSAQSEVFGVPVALLGLGWSWRWSALCSPWAWRSAVLVDPDRAHGRAGRLGMVFVLWLVYAELFVTWLICRWCTVVHVLTFALFVIVVMYGTQAAEDA